MTTEELNRRKLYILQEIEALIVLQREACIKVKSNIAFIASSSNLHPLHLKAFASDWQEINDLVNNLKEIAIISTRDKSCYFSEKRKAISLQDTQYKSSSSDPDVYWTKPKAKIVIDRVMLNYANLEDAVQTISKLFTDYEEMKNDNVIEALKKAVYIASTMERENHENE